MGVTDVVEMLDHHVASTAMPLARFIRGLTAYGMTQIKIIGFSARSSAHDAQSV